MSLQELRTEHLKDICIPMLIAALLTTAKLWEQPKCSLTGGWIKNMWCVCVCIYIYDELLFSHEKEGNPAICNNMDEP